MLLLTNTPLIFFRGEANFLSCRQPWKEVIDYLKYEGFNPSELKTHPNITKRKRLLKSPVKSALFQQRAHFFIENSNIELLDNLKVILKENLHTLSLVSDSEIKTIDLHNSSVDLMPPSKPLSRALHAFKFKAILPHRKPPQRSLKDWVKSQKLDKLKLHLKLLAEQDYFHNL